MSNGIGGECPKEKLNLEIQDTVQSLKYPENNTICFNASDTTEVLRITPVKDSKDRYEIIFNKEAYPQYGADDFATKFIDIVEEYLIQISGLKK